MNFEKPTFYKLSCQESQTIHKMESSKLQRQKWLLPLVCSLLTSSFLVLTILTTDSIHQLTKIKFQVPTFVESKLQSNTKSRVPRLAYFISGSAGDCKSLTRVLKALYHPLNQYVVHLDLEAPVEERAELVAFVKNEALFKQVGNVRVIVKSNLVTYRGPTMVTNTLHGASILLKEGGDWDWFINLSASDYPLVTQDDMLHTLSTIPRELNFIEHTSDLDWKVSVRAEPVILDPGLYTRHNKSDNKSDIAWISDQKRELPTAFKLFTGSAWMMLSRSFVEFCIWGWDNLPRVVLLYYANFVSSPEGYFHTVICNSEEFRNTTVNHDLHFIAWDNPPLQHPHYLTVADYQQLIESNAPFARKFGKDDPVLDKIDTELLGRKVDGYVRGGWFDAQSTNGTVGKYNAVKITELKPGPGAERLKNLTEGLTSGEDFHAKHCI